MGFELTVTRSRSVNKLQSRADYKCLRKKTGARSCNTVRLGLQGSSSFTDSGGTRPGLALIDVRAREPGANSIDVYVGGGRFFPSDQDYTVARIAPIVARDQPLVGSVSAGV